MFKKILVINPFGIGDVLFTTPVLHSLKQSFPGIKIGYLSNRRSRDVLKQNPFVDYIFVYERDEFAAARKKSIFLWLKQIICLGRDIRRQNFDAALDFSLNTQYGFLAWACGIKKRIGYDFKSRGRFLNRKLTLNGYSQCHIIEYYGRLLEYAGGRLLYRKPELYLDPADLKTAGEMMAQKGISGQDTIVAVVPGGGMSWGCEAYFKHWPAARFAELADKIIEKYRAKVILLGDDSEKQTAAGVRSLMHRQAVDFSGKTTIGLLAAFLSRATLAVANDGGPLHMAVALGIKTVSIFGPVDERVYGPYPVSIDNQIVKKDLSCRPCYRNFRRQSCRRQRQCLNSITAEDAFAAVRSLL